MLLDTVTEAVRRAGDRLVRDHATYAGDLLAAIRANEILVTETLRPALLAALPGSVWDDDEHGTGPMPGGDRWIVDPIGGNINTVHHLPDWNIGVSLVRDGRPELAVLHAPALGETFTATAGGGAHLNGAPIQVSTKNGLADALVGTGQALPRREAAYARRVGDSVATMLRTALYVRFSIPVTQQLAQVAAGRVDAHWQFDNVRSHIGPVLLVREAGGIVTDLDGKPWEITSDGYLAAAPGVHGAALDVLRGRA
jgi:myo-inositol-1(or 4)-monophosphatase